MAAFDLIIGMLIVSGISMACVALYARRFIHRVPAATPFILLMFSAAAWSILYALDLMTSDLPLKVAFHGLRFLFLPFFSVLELWLVLAYVKKTEWLRWDWAGLLLIIPVAASLLGITSQYHSLFRYDFSISMAGPVPVLRYSESAFYSLYSVYSLILLLLAVILLVTETRKNGTLWEPQTVLLTVALALPTAINYASTEGFTLIPGINMAPVLLWIPAALYTLALFSYQFLDIVPIARSRVIETLSRPVLVLDMDGRVIDLNPAACSLFSVTQSSALGELPETIAPDWPDFLALCRQGTSQKWDLVRIRDGISRYFIGTAEPLLTRSGEMEGHLIFLQDVTEQKASEVALRQSEEKYRTIIEGMQDIFYRTDVAGKITMLSPSAAKLAGYDSVDQLIGQDVTAIYVNPDDREKLLSAIRAKGAVDSFPLDLKIHDGTIRHVTTSSHFYRDAAGSVQGVEGVIHDITQQRRAEEALRMANRKLNLLSSITRHDIRNQLMALMAFIQLSGEVLDKPAELEKFLKKTWNIAETISNQITFTKEYEDLGVQAPSWLDIGTCVGKAAEGLPLRDVQVSTVTEGLVVFADPLIEKVFYNLIDNSLRYGGDELTTIRITSHAAEKTRILIFEDDGPGVPDSDKKIIFEKGFGKNTGLGLYLCREILAITGITIAETGISGQGARFEMTVPDGGFRFETRA